MDACQRKEAYNLVENFFFRGRGLKISLLHIGATAYMSEKMSFRENEKVGEREKAGEREHFLFLSLFCFEELLKRRVKCTNVCVSS